MKTVQYNPGTGAFSFISSEAYPIELTPAHTCNVGELAHAMKTFHAALSPLAHYLSALLLLDQKAELPIPAQSGYTFGSFAVLQAQPDGELKGKTTAFMAFRNALRVLYKRVSLAEILVQHGAAVIDYGTALERLCDAQPNLKTRLAEYEQDAQRLASTAPPESFTHTGSLLAELAAARDWTLLREQAQRHLDSSDVDIATDAKRMLALSLANSDETADKKMALEIYRSLAGDDAAKINDIGNMVTLLIEAGHVDESRAAVLDSIRRFPANKRDHLLQLGQRIVEATGDRSFRKQMEAAAVERGKRD